MYHVLREPAAAGICGVRLILAAFTRSKQRYGAPRLTAQLACNALRMALWRPQERYRSYGPWRPVMFSRLSGAAEAA